MAIFNFSPGPSTLPKAVLSKIALELESWNGCGVSVMEMSHRSPEFMQIYHDAQRRIKSLLNIPNHYSVLFLQGGAIGENAILPLNLLKKGQADYVISGAWSQKSFLEAKRYGDVQIAASSELDQFMSVPNPNCWIVRPDADYVHVCTNETVHGTEFLIDDEMRYVLGNVPVAADMSSHLLSRPLNINDYGVIYAGAQKNVGIAGLTIVIVRQDLLGHAHSLCPNAFNWTLANQNDSMFNTPPTFAIYVAGLMLDWLEQQGGVAAIEQVNQQKSQLIYDAIERYSYVYECRVDLAYRSRMNVCFFLKNDVLQAPFLEGAKARGLLNLKGHKMVGGIRASLYNAMPLEGAQALTQYMADFANGV